MLQANWLSAWLLPLLVAQLPAAFEPLPEIKHEELLRPNHILTVKNRKNFCDHEVIPVGQFLEVVLPVQQGTNFAWKLEDYDRTVLKTVDAKSDGKPDLRRVPREFEEPAPGRFGRPDALQLFRFEVVKPARDLPLRFRKVRLSDGQPAEGTRDETTFEARITARAAG